MGEINTLTRAAKVRLHHEGAKKNQTRMSSLVSQVLSRYAKGMTTREITAFFKEMQDGNVSHLYYLWALFPG